MKKITSLKSRKEGTLAIPLRVFDGRFRFPSVKMASLAPGKSMLVEDCEISDELAQVAKNGHVSIEDVVTIENVPESEISSSEMYYESSYSDSPRDNE